MGRINNWLENRTGYRELMLPIHRRVLPSGPSWFLSTASCLLWLIILQVLTGLVLMTSYSPSLNNAWASVHFIEQTPAGQLVRGLHFYTGQAILIVFAIHLVRVLLVAAFRPPRELIWATGLVLIPLMMVWAITGNPLNGSQRGFSQIQVEGNIIGGTPVVGPIVQKILIGGDQVGNLTLTHLYALHVGALPLVVGLLLALHIFQVYRHGLSSMEIGVLSATSRPYFPYQTIRNLTVVGIAFATLGWLAYHFGAPLDAPADPELPQASRPEWYFLFLFELRGYFSGETEYIATVIIPVAVLLFLLVLPFVDAILPQWASRSMHGTVVLAGVVAWSVLTGRSLWRDHNDPHIQQEKLAAHQFAVRARELADGLSIPPEGAATLLQNDAKTQGPRLFKQYCVSCHPYTTDAVRLVGDDEPSAPDLGGIGTHDWIAGFLDPEQITSEKYFGNTEHVEGEMVSFVTDDMDLDEDGIELVIAALTAEAALRGHEPDADDAESGRELIAGDAGCIECHKFYDDGDIGLAPELTGYASHDWLVGMISNPGHDRFYGEYNDRMPSFDPEAETAVMTKRELEMLVNWLRGEWYRAGEEPDEATEPDQAAEPDEAAEASETAEPVEEPEPTVTPDTTDDATPAEEPKAADESKPAEEPDSSDTTEASDESQSADAPESSDEPESTVEPEPSDEPASSAEPESTGDDEAPADDESASSSGGA